MNLDPVIAQLKDAGLPRVDGVGDFSLIAKEQLQFLPATFVLPESERGGETGGVTGKFEQRIDCVFLVYLIVGGETANAEAIDADFKRWSKVIEDTLAGWVHPDAGGTATSFVKADTLSVRGREYGWGMSFRTVRRIRRNLRLNPD